jgi:hypothetical protein
MTSAATARVLLGLVGVCTATAAEFNRVLTEEKEKGEEQEEEGVSDVGFAVAVMLLGSLAFFMTIFYLVNFPDPDIVRYSWHVISSTVSIFCAVLMFQSVNGLVVNFFLGAEAEGFSWEGLIIGMLHTAAWFFVLQLVLAIETGATVHKAKRVFKSDAEEKEAEEQSELNVKAAGQLLAHMTGFATINAFGYLQHSPIFQPLGVLGAFLAVPMAGVGMLLFFWLLQRLRKVIIDNDGDTEEDEKWEDETEEAENEVLSLSLSFLTVQALRFWIGGELPDIEGAETLLSVHNHTYKNVLMLALGAVIFGGAAVGLVAVRNHLAAKAQAAVGDEHAFSRRFAVMGQGFCTMGKAWCIFYASRWAVEISGLEIEETLLRVLLAMLVTTFSFCFIFALDKIADSHHGDDTEAAIKTIIGSTGILIGFSWEQAFDEGVEGICEKITVIEQHWTKLILAIFLVGLVLPAWRIWILRNLGLDQSRSIFCFGLFL